MTESPSPAPSADGMPQAHLGPNTETFAPGASLGAASEVPPATGRVEAPPTEPAEPPRWAGKKTAIVAALAIGFSSAGAIAAAAALPQSDTAGRFGGRQGGPPGGFGQGGPGQGGFGPQGTSQGGTSQGGTSQGGTLPQGGAGQPGQLPGAGTGSQGQQGALGSDPNAANGAP